MKRVRSSSTGCQSVLRAQIRPPELENPPRLVPAGVVTFVTAEDGDVPQGARRGGLEDLLSPGLGAPPLELERIVEAHASRFERGGQEADHVSKVVQRAGLAHLAAEGEAALGRGNGREERRIRLPGVSARGAAVEAEGERLGMTRPIVKGDGATFLDEVPWA